MQKTPENEKLFSDRIEPIGKQSFIERVNQMVSLKSTHPPTRQLNFTKPDAQISPES